jgi:hypothetical protein
MRPPVGFLWSASFHEDPTVRDCGDLSRQSIALPCAAWVAAFGAALAVVRFAGAAPPDEAAVAEAGAKGADARTWWSLRPLSRPDVPALHTRAGDSAGPHEIAASGRSPIDAFVFDQLQREDFAPAPEADRRTLIRRLSFDLLGLPPVPEDVDAFTADPSPDAFERLADRLLASPRHGERWARHWMDAAHFAETHGHDQDRVREHAWPYRDYLVAAFNADKPYARFVEEQVAGDVLFPDDPGAVPALGFLASGPWDESSLRDIREDTLDREIGRYLDRDDVVATVMQTFASTTVQCARCHDHKFDPVPQEDYYALQAVFAGVDKANREYEPDPGVHRERRRLKRLLAAVEGSDRTLLLAKEAQAEVEAWEAARSQQDVEWRVVVPETFVSTGGATLALRPDGSLLAAGPRPERDTYTLSAPSPLAAVTALRLEVLPDPSLPQRGPGRTDNGNLHLSELRLLAFAAGAVTGTELKLRNPSSDFDQEGWTAAHAIDGDLKTAWGVFPRVGEPHEAVFELAERLSLPAGGRLAFVFDQVHGGGHLIGRFRLAVTDAEPPSRASVLPLALREVLAVPPSGRSDDQRAALAAHVLGARARRELAALPGPALVYAAASDFAPDAGHRPAGSPRPVHVLRRGDVRRPGEAAAPGALECVAGMPAHFEVQDLANEGARRAALAKWLSDPRQPLTWRSIANRLWHHHFGRGLVETPNDFGRMGGLPSHPELLDWLAVRLRDGGGSLKDLHRAVVTSATWRQSVRQVTELAARDGSNRLLWRANRQRLDAESVRDAVLAISGRLDLRMGGPSDRQFDLKPGIHVTPRIDYGKFDLDSDAGRRRSVYRFLFRTLPDPLMDALDCPAGDQLTPARNASVTVAQALALWNSAFVARHSEHLAVRLEGLGATIEERVAAAVPLAFGRPAAPEEIRELAAYAEKHGLAGLCRLLLNANEFVFVN